MEMIAGLDITMVVLLALGGIACTFASVRLYIARKEDQ